MDLKNQQDIDFYESEKKDKERKEEFLKMVYTVSEQDPIPLSKEELRKARILFFEKKIELNKTK